MTEVLKAGVLSDEIDLGALAHNAAEQAEEFVRKVSLDDIYALRSTWIEYRPSNNIFYHKFRCGKHRGRCVITNICRNGCRTTISCIATIVHRYHRFAPALNQFFAFTRKPETFGHICLVASHLLESPRTFWRVHQSKFNYRRKLFSVPFS